MAGAAALMPLLQQILGGKQLGGIAPPFQAGQMGMQEGGILDAIKRIQQPQQEMPQLGSFLGGGYEEAQPAAAPQEQVTSRPSVFNTQEQNDAMGTQYDPKDPSFLAKFFGNLDSTFSSPSKQLGLGLLGQVSPYLGWGGLLGAGLWGDKLK